MFRWILIGMGVLEHPQFGLLCGAALPGAFFLEKHAFHQKNMISDDFRLVKMDLIWY